MRTKLLLGVAAIAAAGALSAVAQNVYSLNVVGYYNLTLPPGFSLIANQLDLDGTGTNNTPTTVFSTNVPVNTQVFTWNGSGYNIASLIKEKNGSLTWSSAEPISLNPGQAFWIDIPAGSGTNTYTLVGQVLQGGLVNPNLPAAGGYSFVSGMVPIAGGVQTALGYVPAINDTVYQWSGTGFNIINSFIKQKSGGGVWNPQEPQLRIGEGFWLDSQPGQVWSNYFVVGP